MNFHKVQKILNFTPKYSIEYGISEIIDALKNNQFYDYIKNKFNYGNYELIEKK